MLDIVQDFIYDHVPDYLRGLKDENFDTLFVRTSFDIMDWTVWCFRNFPFTLTFSKMAPQWVRRCILPGEAANVELLNVRFPTVPFLFLPSLLISPATLLYAILDLVPWLTIGNRR